MSVHNDTNYIDFQYEPNIPSLIVLISILLACVPFIVYGKMIFVYMHSNTSNSSAAMPKHLFWSLIQMGIANFMFFIFDTLVFRAPATGFLTSYCASIEPNHFLKVMYILQLSSAYWSMLFSLWFCLVRIVILKWTMNHKEVCNKIFRYYFPISIACPFISAFFMWPALGYCRQWLPPLSFGAIYISFQETILNIRTDRVYVALTFAVPILIIIANTYLIVKGRQLLKKATGKSVVTKKKSECSFIATAIAMVLPFLFHGGFTIASLIYPGISTWVVFGRSIITDISQASIPVALYFTHPMFKKIKLRSTDATIGNSVSPALSNVPRL